MGARGKLELLFLHALPLDGSMWAAQENLLPGATHAPTLYGLGNTVEAWAAQALRLVNGDRLIVVGCSVGGSCALELAMAAPDRVAALVLIGTKARHWPDPAQHASTLEMLDKKGLEDTWDALWSPLFSRSAEGRIVDHAKSIALHQSPRDVACGVTAFHTRPSREQVLATFPRPTIVVTGADDSAPGPKVSAAQAGRARQGRLHVVPQCGHYVPLERPAELNVILRELIASQS